MAAYLSETINEISQIYLQEESEAELPVGIDPWGLKDLHERTKEILAHPKLDVSDGYHTFGELYEHRHALFGALLVLNKGTAWWSEYHDDGSRFDGYLIAGFEPEEGSPVTYHMPEQEWAPRFKNMGITHLKKAPPWDGHTSKDAIHRLVKGFFGEA